MVLSDPFPGMWTRRNSTVTQQSDQWRSQEFSMDGFNKGLGAEPLSAGGHWEQIPQSVEARRSASALGNFDIFQQKLRIFMHISAKIAILKQ